MKIEDKSKEKKSAWGFASIMAFFSSNIGKIIRYGIVFLIVIYLLYKFVLPLIQYAGRSTKQTSAQTLSTSIQGGEALAKPVAAKIKKQRAKRQRNETKAFIKSLDRKNKENSQNSAPQKIFTNIRNAPIKTNLLSGYCFIGIDKGQRNCMSVKESDKCLSGDIFPSKEVCINPNLRY